MVLPDTAAPGYRVGKRAALLYPLTMAILLSGCSAINKIDPTPTGAIARAETSADFDNMADTWAARYRADPQKKTVALGYAKALRQSGKADQAVAVLQKTAIHYPNDREILAAFGKALAANGELSRALGTIQRAQTPEQPDWRLLSAEAAILDQLGRSGEARRLYAKAADLAPNEPSILSNYGMSYILTRELDEAERLLRRAVAMDGADSRIRQNLALAVGLAGRFDEAEAIAVAELPPQEAEANMAYLRQVLGERDDWQKLAEGS